MSSALQLAVQSILFNDYASLMLVVVVGYDYVLMIPDEIEYIWSKPWTRVSTLFVIVRYCGLLNCMTGGLLGSSFFPGPEKLQLLFWLINELSMELSSFNSCYIANIFATWFLLFFLAAAELAMILRVWALYNRSRIILGTLLTVYTIEIFVNAFNNVIYPMENFGTVQILNLVFCTQPLFPYVPVLMLFISEIVLGALMYLLVIAHFIWSSFQMYKATKHVHPSRYVNLFVREGIVYFLVILSEALVNLLVEAGDISMSRWYPFLLAIMGYILVMTLVPRFILNLRKLYARDQRDGRGSQLDTAFGLSSASGDNGGGSAIMFADRPQNEEEGEEEEIRMEEWEHVGA